MTLSEYIKDIGDSAAAEKLNVTVRTAAAYRRGEREPRPKKAREITQITNGLVSLDECFKEKAA